MRRTEKHLAEKNKFSELTYSFTAIPKQLLILDMCAL